MDNDRFLYVVGDVHGYRDVMVRHLVKAGLATEDAEWTGGTDALWFMGDFTDRGPEGTGTIDFVMRLQEDAARKGGEVGAVLGNHDVALLSAKLLPKARTTGPIGNFHDDWLEYGGTASDLPQLQERHVEWLQNLPAMARVGDKLLMHADAMYYLGYGDSVARVNEATRELLKGHDAKRWDEMLAFAGQRYAFDEGRPGGDTRAYEMLALYGGKQMIHGHTPIPKLNDAPVASVTSAYEYCNGLAVDVDGWIYKGGPGFVHRVKQTDDGRREIKDERLGTKDRREIIDWGWAKDGRGKKKD